MLQPPTASRFHGPAPSAAPTAASSPCRNPESPKALANSCADVNRSAGSFSSAFLIAASTLVGTDVRSSVADASLP